MRTQSKRILLAICASVLALGAGAETAWGATSDPLFVYVPTTPAFNGPCGLGVDSTGRFYVSDYYHHAVDVFNSTPSYSNQLANEDPLDGPCGLALNASNNLYVNNFHRNVVKFNPSPSFGAGTVLTGGGVDSLHPTGVAVDISNNVYVNDRTYIQEYNSTGTPVQQIGLGNLGDGYGVAVSQFLDTLGYVYVPDASTNTVKVYDPLTSLTTPKAEIKDPFNDPFVSLRDSAIAVDRVTGDVYFADNTQPQLTEKPQATIYVYGFNDSTKAHFYKGHLKYNIADALPPGLAVDNSGAITQGRVYVTSGNTTQAGVYAYGPGAGTFATPLPPTVSLAMSAAGSGAGAIAASAPTTIDCSSDCEAEIRSGAQVTLSADPDPGSTFEGWSGGGCAGTSECTVTMDEEKSVGAEFAAEVQSGGSSGSGNVQASTQAPAPSSQPLRAKRPHHRHKRRRHHPARHHRHRIPHHHRVFQ
jgi:hypothetical protein